MSHVTSHIAISLDELCEVICNKRRRRTRAQSHNGNGSRASAPVG